MPSRLIVDLHPSLIDKQCTQCVAHGRTVC
jgi:hypothetical protein